MRIRKGRWAIVEQEELFRLYDNGVPLEEIAEEFGIKRERTRQIKEKALRRLKNRSRSKKLECYL